MVKRAIRLFSLIFVLLSCLSIAHAEETPDVGELQYVVKDGSLYYESSWGCGSGRYDIVGADNSYTNIPCVVGLNGYSFLDENGDVLTSDYIEEETDILIPHVPNGAVKLFMHFHGPVYRNGWTDVQNIRLRSGRETDIPEELWSFFYPDGLPLEEIDENEKETPIVESADSERADLHETPQVSYNPSKEFEEIISSADNNSVKKTPEQVADNLGTITANSKTAILVDISGSMHDCYKTVLSYLEGTEFPEDTVFVAFNEEAREVTYEELLEMVAEPKGNTDIHGALNYVTNSLEVDTVILLSDMVQSTYKFVFFPRHVEIEENSTVSNLIIYSMLNYKYYVKKETECISGKWNSGITSFVIEES